MQDDILRENGLKATESRKIILKILTDQIVPMAANELFNEAKKQISLDYSTVYRILSAFTKKNIILKSVGGDGISYYQLHNHNHNHYLVCSECHKRVMIDGCPLDQVSDKLVEKTGFHITGHNLEFIGECPDCIKRKKG